MKLLLVLVAALIVACSNSPGHQRVGEVDSPAETTMSQAQLLYLGVEKGGHVSISRAPDPKGCTH